MCFALPFIQREVRDNHTLLPKILNPQVITEDLDDLKELEKYHRYSHLFQRLRMLRLLKSQKCSNLGEAARALGYSSGVNARGGWPPIRRAASRSF
jgi:hypothetical protein